MKRVGSEYRLTKKIQQATKGKRSFIYCSDHLYTLLEFFFLLYFAFQATLGGTQDLFLALCSGITQRIQISADKISSYVQGGHPNQNTISFSQILLYFVVDICDLYILEFRPLSQLWCANIYSLSLIPSYPENLFNFR